MKRLIPLCFLCLFVANLLTASSVFTWLQNSLNTCTHHGRTAQYPPMRLYVAILTLALQQQCHLVNPETARSQADQALKPYFPHAHAIVNGGTLIGITCADLGLAAIQELPSTLDKNSKVQQLKGFSGLAGIGSFALGFPDTILSLDLVTKRYQTFSTATIPGYARDYTTLCTTAGSQYAITAAPIAPITSEQP